MEITEIGIDTKVYEHLKTLITNYNIVRLVNHRIPRVVFNKRQTFEDDFLSCLESLYIYKRHATDNLLLSIRNTTKYHVLCQGYLSSYFSY